MSRDQQFLELYRRTRVGDQLTFYRARRREYLRASRQLAAVSAVVYGLSSAVAVVAGLEIAGAQTLAVLAVVIPALSTAVTAYGSLYRFDEHAKVYTDAARALIAIPPPDESSGHEAFVQRVEEVLRAEHGQWGQLVADTDGATDATVAPDSS